MTEQREIVAAEHPLDCRVMRLTFNGEMVFIKSWWRGWMLGEGIERAISTVDWFLTGKKPKYLRAWRGAYRPRSAGPHWLTHNERSSAASAGSQS